MTLVPSIIRSIDEAEECRKRVLNATERTMTWLDQFSDHPLILLKKLRFETVGHHPLTGEALNVIEQVNQTFTILASLKAVEFLMELHPSEAGFRLALATASGRDIESVEPNLVAAEVFAATHPSSNQKLNKDLARLANDPARFRYVFFASPKYSAGRHLHLERVPGVEVHSVEI